MAPLLHLEIELGVTFGDTMRPGNCTRAIFFSAFIGIFFFNIGPKAAAQFSNPIPVPLSATTVPESQLMQPAELLQLIRPSQAAHPLLLQVGSHIMFSQAHIPGSVFAGPGAQASGLRLLESKVAAMPKDKLIVIYCGCCPWGRCPNIGPAFRRLHELGFTNVKALYIANNFGDDWVARGYQVDKGE
jgi:thiosulfate/3-mercaptopyruvate sulfurtransferase